MKNEHPIYPPPYKLKAFTLAEVLITLVIIGVVAAITVPTLMNNTNAQEFRSALKKAISGVNQALTLHYALEGLGAQDYDSKTELINDVFKARMNVVEINENTFPAGYVLQGPGGNVPCTPDANNSFITQDGIVFCIINFSSHSPYSNIRRPKDPCDFNNQNPCVPEHYYYPNLYIDVNCDRKPNKATRRSSQPRDQYWGLIYNSKVEPWGVTQEIMFDKQVSTDANQEEKPEGELPPPLPE